jgi:hypothetical protein
MAKTKISEFDTNPDNNTDINSVNIAEGCAPSGINNAIRQLMSDLKEFQTGAASDPLTVGGVATFTAGTASAPAITTTGDTNTGIFFPAADTIAFAEGGVESMRLDSSGNLGIGTASPAAKLHVLGASQSGIFASTSATINYTEYRYNTSTVNGYIGNGGILTGSGTATDFVVRSEAALAFATNGATERMRLDASGRLGIGTTSPPSKFTLEGTNGNVASQIQLVGSGVLSGYIGPSADGLNFGTDGGGLLFRTGVTGNGSVTTGTERMRIDSSGDLLVGTTSLPAAGANTSWWVRASDNYIMGSNANTTGSLVRVYFFNPNGVVGSISTSGSSTTYATSSDYRLKEDIAPMTGALARVAALKPVTYSWKADGSAGEGFIAHELAEVVPDAVVGEKDAVNEDGSIKPQGIDTSFLVATLTAAIQEQQAIITDLKARIESLENK